MAWQLAAGGSSSSTARAPLSMVAASLTHKLVAPEWVDLLRRAVGEPRKILELVADAEAQANGDPKLLNEIFHLGCRALGPLTAKEAQGGANAYLCSRRLQALCRFDEGEARLFFRFLRVQNIAQNDARVHLARAEMELRAGYGQQAAFTLQHALDIEAQPTDILRSFLQQLPPWIIRQAAEEAQNRAAVPASDVAAAETPSSGQCVPVPHSSMVPPTRSVADAPVGATQVVAPTRGVSADSEAPLPPSVAAPPSFVTAQPRQTMADAPRTAPQAVAPQPCPKGVLKNRHSTGDAAASVSAPIRPRLLSFSGACESSAANTHQPQMQGQQPAVTSQRRSLERRSSLARRVSAVSMLSNLSPIVEADSAEAPSLSIEAASGADGQSLDWDGDEDDDMEQEGDRHSPQPMQLHVDGDLGAWPLYTAAAADVPVPALPTQAPAQISNAQPVAALQPSSIAIEATVSSDGTDASSAGVVKSPKTFYVNGVPYVRVRMLGRGGSSKVYEVTGPAGEIRALKRVDVASAADADGRSGGGQLQALSNEVTLLQKLSHCPHIIHVYDAEIIDSGLIHIIMERGDMDLGQFLQAERDLTLGDIQGLWRQMLKAVEAIHQERIVHRDLKPGNFMLVGGQLKLIDFNIAKQLAADTTNIQNEEHPVGTISYMAPEAFEGSGKMGRPSDVWSLGVILYQIAYGRSPFAHLPPQQRLFAIQDPNVAIDYSSAHRLSNYSPATQTLLHDVLQRCLRRRPAERASIALLLEHAFLHDRVHLDRLSFDRAMQEVVASVYAAARAGFAQGLDDSVAAGIPAEEADLPQCTGWQMLADEVWHRLLQSPIPRTRGKSSEDMGNELQHALAPFSQWLGRGIAKRQRVLNPQSQVDNLAPSQAASASRNDVADAQASLRCREQASAQSTKSCAPRCPPVRAANAKGARTGKENVGQSNVRKVSEARKVAFAEHRRMIAVSEDTDSSPEMSQVTKWNPF